MRFLMLLALVIYPVFAVADVAKDDARCDPWPQCGWWFGHMDKLDKEKEESSEKPMQTPIPQDESKTEESKEPCKDKQTWTPDCGFVDPGTDFDFQALQRDQLRTNMVMHPKDPKAVEGFQYYIKWAVNQALLATRMWAFNRIQNPDLNPVVQRPMSQFAIRLLSNARELRDQEIFEAIVDGGGFLVWFTRSDCNFCHDMLPVILLAKKHTNIEVWNLSLDDMCFEAFVDHCRVGDRVIQTAQGLKISIVPSLFLYLPDDNTWIRISTGLEAVTTIERRLVQFFSAMRTAVANNIKNGEGTRPSVDFSKEQVFKTPGLGAGVEENNK